MPYDRVSPAAANQHAERFTCETHAAGRGAAWLSTRGALDLDAAAQLRGELDQALAHALLVIVDLRQLTFIDSTGIQVLLDADNRAHETGHRLLLIRGSEPVGRLLESLGLDDRLKVLDLTPESPTEGSATDAQRAGRSKSRAADLLRHSLRRRGRATGDDPLTSPARK